MAFVARLAQDPRPGGFVRRRALERWVAAAKRTKVGWLDGPAGYGKTTALLQIRQELLGQGAACIGLSLDGSEREADLATLLRDRLRGAGRRIPAPSAPVEDAVAAVGVRLERLRRPTFLFFDDAHQATTEAARLLMRLIDRSHEHAHFIFSGRGLGRFKVARLRAYGRLFEIGQDELRFDEDETADFLNRMAGGVTQAIRVQGAEGWPAGLSLLAMDAQPPHRGPGEIATEIATESGTALSDFFNEEVLARERDDMQQFLMTIAVCDEFDLSFCRDVLNVRGADTLLSQAIGRRLFVEDLGGGQGRYRLHPLFSQTLRARAIKSEPGKVEALHITISKWFADHDSGLLALKHASQGGDQAWLAELLERYADDLHRSGRLWNLGAYASDLALSALAHSPRVLLGLAWLRTRSRRFNESRKILSVFQKHLDQLKAEGAGQEEAAVLEPLLAHQKAMLALAQDDETQATDLCRRLIPELEAHHPHFACTLYGPMIGDARRQFRFEDLERQRAIAERHITELGYNIANVALQAEVGPSLMILGKTDAAVASMRRAVKIAQDHAGSASGVEALVALPLGAALYEIGELDEAARLVSAYLPTAGQFCGVDQLIAGHTTAARLAAATSGFGPAHQALDAAEAACREKSLATMKLQIAAERVRLLMAEGAVKDASRVYRQAQIPRDPDEFEPGRGMTTRNALLATTWVRVNLCSGQARQALEMARQWRNLCLNRGAVLDAVRWDVLSACGYHHVGDVRSARKVRGRP